MRLACDESVFPRSSHSVAVFVQPTNALVSQTFASFLSDPKIGKKNVALFTGERRENCDNCDYKVLVTNPQCLEILLLSADGNRVGDKSFFQRLCYVVFDEIHCIGSKNAEGGNVWERLLCMINCPVIGLSATLSNIDNFYRWMCDLKAVQKAQRLARGEILPSDGASAVVAAAGADADNDANNLTAQELSWDDKANDEVSPMSPVVLGDASAVDRLELNSIGKEVEIIIHEERSTALHYYRFTQPQAVVSASGNRVKPPMEASSINSIALLASVLTSSASAVNDAVLTSYLRNCPTAKGSELLEILDLLAAKCVDDLNDVPDQFFDLFLSEIDSSSSVLAVIRDLVSKYTDILNYFQNLKNPKGSNKTLDLANNRHYIARGVKAMHAIIENMPRLNQRVLVDAYFASKFATAEIDWYGRQWLSQHGELEPVTEASVVQEIKTMVAAKRSTGRNVVLATIHACSSVLFCFQSTDDSLYDPPSHAKLFLSNVFALHRAVVYLLQLILKSDGDSRSVIALTAATTATAAINENQAPITDELSAYAAAARTSLISILDQLNRNAGILDVDGVAEIKYLSRNNIKAISKFFWSAEHLYEAGNPLSSVVIEPTLLFHLNQANIKQFILHMLETTEECCPELTDNFYLNDSDDAEIIRLCQLHEMEDWQAKALRLGVAQHTAATKKGYKYLRLVERLFQERKLKFVFATTSLSYGINMPTANVVFLLPSMHLDSSTFRQCSGRAGRRGYGSGIGSIYFFGFSENEIVRKLCLPLEKLEAKLSVSTSDFYRNARWCTTCLETDSSWNNDATLRILLQPLFEYLIDDDRLRQRFKKALVHSALFSWSFLNDFLLLKSDGKPTIKSDLVQRLFYTQPYCFVLAELLHMLKDPHCSSGFQSLVNVQRQPVLKSLVQSNVSILANHLNLLALDRALLASIIYLIGDDAHGDRDASASKLPDTIRDCWNDYNAKVMASVVEFMRAQSKLIFESTLPLLGSNDPQLYGAPDKPLDARVAGPVNRFLAWLTPRSNTNPDTNPIQGGGLQVSGRPICRSAYAALSGRSDQFSSVMDMILSAKDGVFVSKSVIPAVDPPDAILASIECVYLDQSFVAALNMDKDIKMRCENISGVLRKIACSAEMVTGYAPGKPAPSDLSMEARVVVRALRRIQQKFDLSLSIAIDGPVRSGEGRIVHVGATYGKIRDLGAGHAEYSFQREITDVMLERDDRVEFQYIAVGQKRTVVAITSVPAIRNVRRNCWGRFQTTPGSINPHTGHMIYPSQCIRPYTVHQRPADAVMIRDSNLDPRSSLQAYVENGFYYFSIFSKRRVWAAGLVEMDSARNQSGVVKVLPPHGNYRVGKITVVWQATAVDVSFYVMDVVQGTPPLRTNDPVSCTVVMDCTGNNDAYEHKHIAQSFDDSHPHCYYIFRVACRCSCVGAHTRVSTDSACRSCCCQWCVICQYVYIRKNVYYVVIM